MLEKIGHKVNVVSGIYDAIKEIESDLPRLIISEYETTDGNLIHLLDKIEKNPYTSHIPVVAILDTANSANMGQLKDRNIKEFFKPKSNLKISCLSRIQLLTVKVTVPTSETLVICLIQMKHKYR